MDEKGKAELEAMGIKVRSGTQEEADALGILIHPVASPQPPRKEVFLMRAEGQSFEDYVKAFIEALRAKGMLTEKKSEQKEQLNVPKNAGGIEQQGIEGETDE